jgi:hypothetical protein
MGEKGIGVGQLFGKEANTDVFGVKAKQNMPVEKPLDSKRAYTLRLRTAVVSGRLTQRSK